jgi:nucleoside-diphosphate-sugar epimerase
MSMDRVLVTGGAGYIGCILVRKLLDQGYSVRVLDRLFWGLKPLGETVHKIELVEGDIRDVRDEWLDGIDAIVHLAGLSNDPTADFDPDLNWQMNAIGTENLAAAAKRAGISRFTFGSSCSIYDGLPAGQVYDEDAPVAPRGGYSEGKRYGELRLQELANENFTPVILRQGTVYGFSPRMRYDLVVNTFVKDAMKNGVLSLHGDGGMWRPLVDVDDVAQAHIAALAAPDDAVRGQIFNVMHDNYQVRDVARFVIAAMKKFGYVVEEQFSPAPPRVRDYKCANEKMKLATGFAPSRSIPESVLHMVNWIRSDGFMEFTNPRFYNIQWMELSKSSWAPPAQAGLTRNTA